MCVRDTLLSVRCWSWPREVCRCLPCPPQSQESDGDTQHVPGQEEWGEDGVTRPGHQDSLTEAQSLGCSSFPPTVWGLPPGGRAWSPLPGPQCPHSTRCPCPAGSRPRAGGRPLCWAGRARPHVATIWDLGATTPGEAMEVRLTGPGARTVEGQALNPGLPLSPRAEWLGHKCLATKPHLGKGRKEEGGNPPPAPAGREGVGR